MHAPSLSTRLPCLALLAALLAHAARGDTLGTPTGPLDGTVNGLRNGKASITLKSGVEKQFELTDITAISLDQLPAFGQAEAMRDDALKAAASYKSLIPALNKPDLKLLAQARAIEPFDRQGQWSEAVAAFLDVYLAQPTDAAWKLRPTHFPAAGSRLLADSADRVATAVKAARSDEARKNLRSLLLDIYNRAGDTQNAQRVAQEIAGISTDPLPPPPPQSAPDATINFTLSQLEAALRGGKYDQVLQQADALLPGAQGSPETATQLFSLKARALESQNKLEDAIAAWLRIPAHYPDNVMAPTALAHAAAIQQKLNHPEQAGTLLDEIRTAYPASPEAGLLKGK